MGNTKKTRRKYSDHHSASTELFTLSTPKLLSMIHSPEGRKELWKMAEAEEKNHPEYMDRINSLKRNLMKYDQLQGVNSNEER